MYYYFSKFFVFRTQLYTLYTSAERSTSLTQHISTHGLHYSCELRKVYSAIKELPILTRDGRVQSTVFVSLLATVPVNTIYAQV